MTTWGRDLLSEFLKKIGPCSGQNEAELRAWLLALDEARDYSINVDDETFVAHVCTLATPPLSSELHSFVTKKRSEKSEISWKQLREAIVSVALPPDEARLLRNELETLKQMGLEDERSYMSRFGNLLKRAYTPDQQSGLILERLLTTFIRGFKSSSIREKILLEDPKTIQDAMKQAERFSNAAYLANNDLMGPGFSRNVEPMDVDLEETTQKFKSTKIEAPKSPKSPERRVTFSGRVLRRNSSGNVDGPSLKRARSSSRTGSVSDGRMETSLADTPSVQCQYCGLSNHYAVNCYKRLRDEDRCFHCRKVGHHQHQCWSLNQNDNPNRKRAFRRFEQQNEKHETEIPWLPSTEKKLW